MFLVLQQIEGNLIYPHVVGNSVGLPSIWVLAAVTLGGKLLGVSGILLFIPLGSVCYALFRNFIKGRLKDKNIAQEKWAADHIREKVTPPVTSSPSENQNGCTNLDSSITKTKEKRSFFCHKNKK